MLSTETNVVATSLRWKKEDARCINRQHLGCSRFQEIRNCDTAEANTSPTETSTTAPFYFWRGLSRFSSAFPIIYGHPRIHMFSHHSGV